MCNFVKKTYIKCEIIVCQHIFFVYICEQIKLKVYGTEHIAGFVEMETERAS